MLDYLTPSLVQPQPFLVSFPDPLALQSGSGNETSLSTPHISIARSRSGNETDIHSADLGTGPALNVTTCE